MSSWSPTVPRLSVCDVHVWRISLVGDGDHHVMSLSAAERARLERRRGVQRDLFAISHGAMRQVLGLYLGCAAADVPVESCYGRPPRVAGLELSLAHCDELALLAVALHRVGVDVESTANEDDDDLELLAEATLTPAELRGFVQAAVEERSRLWLRSWVRKEAVLKARGLGLGDHALCELDVSGDRIGGLAVVDLNVGPGHLAAIALTPPARRVSVGEWADESR